MGTTRPPFGYRDGEDRHGRSLRELAAQSPGSIEFPGAVLAGDSPAGLFITDLLQAEPSARLGYAGADEIRAHSWFRDFDWGVVAVERASEDQTGAVPDFDD